MLARAKPLLLLLAAVCLPAFAHVPRAPLVVQKPHQGVERFAQPLHRGPGAANALTAPGLARCLYDKGGISRSTAKERDVESGLDYFLARYYSGSLGRFTGPDPKGFSKRTIENPMKWNKYAYVLNNPLALVDPDGKEEVTVQLRAYIPYASVGPFRGDNRGPTTSQNVTSRTAITVRVETDPSIAQNPLLSSSGGQAGISHNDVTGASATQTVGLPTANATRDKNGSVVINFKQHSRAKWDGRAKWG